MPSPRINDPETAPFVPVYTHIKTVRLSPESSTWETTILITAWDRGNDEIVEYRFKTFETGTMTRRPLDEEDAQWLHAIGARSAGVL